MDFASYQDWAVKNKIHKDVVGYLSFAKQDLYDFDAKSSSRAFATPRTWTFVSQLLEDEDGDNDTLTNLIAGSFTTRGFFSWRDGKKDTEVIWTPDPRGRFNISWVPPRGLQNRVERKGDLFYPMNEHIGAFGCDSYDISGTVDGFGSNGALHGLTKFNMEDAPSNEFFLEYVARNCFTCKIKDVCLVSICLCI